MYDNCGTKHKIFVEYLQKNILYTNNIKNGVFAV